jgi:hypothetical protein
MSAKGHIIKDAKALGTIFFCMVSWWTYQGKSILRIRPGYFIHSGKNPSNSQASRFPRACACSRIRIQPVEISAGGLGYLIYVITGVIP